MSEKTFWKLAVAAAVLLVLSIIVGSSDRSPTFEFKPGYPLVTNLDPAKVDTIEVKSDDGDVLLKRVADGSFVVADLHNYPAAVTKISGLIGDLLRIRCSEKIGDDPDGHDELGLQVPGTGNTSVRFLDRDGQPILGVLLSTVTPGAQYIEDGASAQYARIDGEDTVYKVDGVVHLGAYGMHYVEKSVLGIEFNDCEKVQVKPAEGPAYVLTKPVEGDVVVESMPPGMRKNGTAADEVLTSSYGVQMEALAPLSELQDAQFSASYLATSRGHAQYLLEFAKRGEEWWLRGKAAYIGPESINVEGMEATEEGVKEAEALAKAVQAVEQFNRLHQGWAYRVASWKAERMTQPLADLIEPIPEQPKEGEAPAAESEPK